MAARQEWGGQLFLKFKFYCLVSFPNSDRRCTGARSTWMDTTGSISYVYLRMHIGKKVAFRCFHFPKKNKYRNNESHIPEDGSLPGYSVLGARTCLIGTQKKSECDLLKIFMICITNERGQPSNR